MANAGDGRNGVALVLGIGRYQRPSISSLRYAAGDARAVYDLLLDPVVCRFPKDKVQLLADGEATRQAVVRGLSKWLPETAAGAELALLYFAGHGMVNKVAGREEGYLLPHDADPEALDTWGVPLRAVTRWCGGIRPPFSAIFGRACGFAGRVLPRSPESNEPVARAVGLPPRVLPGVAGEGRFLIASCGEGQFSYETPELKHG